MATIFGGIAERERYMYTGTTEPSQKLSRFGKVPSLTWLTSCLHMFLEAMSVPYMFSNARVFAMAHIIILIMRYHWDISDTSYEKGILVVVHQMGILVY